MSDCHGASTSSLVSGPNGASSAHKTIALVGPPNAGKTTLFNRLTGLRQKVANYPGVTVEHHAGRLHSRNGAEVDLIDLPGIYSLDPRSEDERVTHDVLRGDMAGIPRPDAILLILDATNLSRHLVVAAPVLSLGLPTLVILNMADDLRDRGGTLDTTELSQRLGVPVVLASAAKGEGLEPVFEFLDGTLAVPPPSGSPFPILNNLPSMKDVPSCRAWATRVSQGAWKAPMPSVWSRRLDAVFLHPLAGPLIFALVVVIVFQAIFTGATPLMDGVEGLIGDFGKWVATTLPESSWRDLLTEGVIAGVGGVVVFLPQILLLFLFIGILEDSGYLARAALIADRTMARFGLQGKSFIPLLSAYACAVPAIMATRTIENKRDRIATILIAPFMTCSARLPVYTLVIAAFIPERPILSHLLGTRAAAMIGLYVLGFVAALLTARALKSSVLRSDGTPFLLELPSYRWPTLRSLGLRLYDRAMVFLKRAGTIILACAIGLWIMAHLPLTNGKPPEIRDSLAGSIGRTVEPVIAPLGFNWKIGIGLITSLAAREVIVGTLGTIYGIESEDDTQGLTAALQKDLTPGGAVALLVFFAFAMQCMSTVAVVKRETGGWKWPVVQFSYMTGLAYVCAFAANRIVTAWLG
ncbi:MAG: ferrous iron transport protein B [Bryobacterales bacterium]|nr:ferrous iron transport protein B [Bryobacterales bacterium]